MVSKTKCGNKNITTPCDNKDREDDSDSFNPSSLFFSRRRKSSAKNDRYSSSERKDNLRELRELILIIEREEQILTITLSCAASNHS